jgi:hypothetical protein
MKIRIPYYVVLKGNGYWRPTQRMKALGFEDVRCGRDGPAARALAMKWYEKWQAARGPTTDRQPRKEAGFVYFLVMETRINIGFSRDPLTRAGSMKTGFSTKVSSVLAVRGTRNDERRLHSRFAAYRSSGEWFNSCPALTREMMRAIAFGRITTGEDGEQMLHRLQPHTAELQHSLSDAK